MYASENGHVEAVDKLLQHGARVDLQEEVHFICLNYILHMHIHVYMYCITHNFYWQDGWHPLMYASQNGHVEVVDKLLQHGARVDLQSKVCFTF